MSPDKQDCCQICRFASECLGYNDHRCLRHAPKAATGAPRGVEDHGMWPLVKGNEWCGDFERHPGRVLDPRW